MKRENKKNLREVLHRFMVEYGIIFTLITLVIIFGYIEPRFLTLHNMIDNVMRQTSLLAIVAIGLTFVMTMGEFDLSIGFMMTLAGIVAVKLVAIDVSPPLVFLTALIVGLGGGILNGFLVTKGKLISFIATLGTGTIFVGSSFYISGGATVFVGGMPDWFLFLGQQEVLGVPCVIPIMAAIAFIGQIILEYTQFGRSMHGIGGNVEACVVAGVNVDRTKWIGFALCGFLSGLAGLILASRLGAAHPKAGDAFLMRGFAAVFLGMTMRGGKPSIIGTLIGSLFLSIIYNGFRLIGFPYRYEFVVTGLIIVASVGVTYLVRGETRLRGIV